MANERSRGAFLYFVSFTSVLSSTLHLLYLYIIFRHYKKEKKEKQKGIEIKYTKGYEGQWIEIDRHRMFIEQSKPCLIDRHRMFIEQSKTCLIDNPWNSRQQARFDENTKRSRERKKRRRSRRRKVIETRKVWNEERTSVYIHIYTLVQRDKATLSSPLRWRRTFFPSVSAAKETREREEEREDRDGRRSEEVDISRGENLNKTRGRGGKSSLFHPLFRYRLPLPPTPSPKEMQV